MCVAVCELFTYTSCSFMQVIHVCKYFTHVVHLHQLFIRYSCLGSLIQIYVVPVIGWKPYFKLLSQAGPFLFSDIEDGPPLITVLLNLWRVNI